MHVYNICREETTMSVSASVLTLTIVLQQAYFSVATNCSDVAIVNKSEDYLTEEYYCINDLPNIENNTEVRIYSKELFLTKTLKFIDIINVSVVGYNNSILRCLNGTKAGLSFSNVHNLMLKNIETQNCASELEIDRDPYRNIQASISIQNCANVWISEIRVMNGPGSGLALFDIEESLAVLDSTFEGNGHDGTSGGNGVYLEVSRASKSLGSLIQYNLTRCHFIDNKASTGKDNKISGFTRFDKGGGLCCLLRGQQEVTVTVEDAVISGNTAASYGGGIFASFSNNATNSVFVVKGSNYSRNYAVYGGAHYSGYLHNQNLGQMPLNCNFVFKSIAFTENQALYGGGISMFSTPTNERSSTTSNRVSFEDCVWWHNIAQFGSAITILPNAWNIHREGFLPTFSFSDCSIDSNYVKTVIDHDNNLFTQYSQGSGALYCTDHTLHFHESTTFSSNNGSALYMGSCTARFSRFSHTTFNNNSGYYGGAIHLLASLIQLDENVELFFESNTAYSKGGAIYHNSFNFHMYNYSRTCFFRNINIDERDPLKRNITVRFIDNFAGTRGKRSVGSTGYGHSMYVYSLLPCHRFYKFLASQLTSNIFSRVGNFTYQPSGRPNEIATDARHSHIHHNRSEESYLSILPGKEEEFPYHDTDDLEHNTASVYLVTILGSDNSSLEVNQAHQYISTNEVKLFGNTNDEATVVLSALTSQQRALFFRVRVLPCPPGFTLKPDMDSEALTCQCAYNTADQYRGILYCRTTLWRAYKTRGYWIGYDSDRNETEDTLVTGNCPIGFCVHKNSLLLPAIADRRELNELICPDSRTGVLCGQCKENNSVYYHSLHFQCKPNNHCKLGWFFYTLTEILPVTIIFLIIIVFNISFTSGIINGFIFYAQVVTMLRITAGGFVPFPPAIYKVIQFLYLGFNLNPLVLDELSFCLFENATALDVIAFSYITLVYSFLLIIGVIVMVNKLSTRNCCKAWRRCTSPKRESLQGSIIHGLSALLVLCYAKCTQASILLISYARIRGKGFQYSHDAVFYNGEIKWFSKEHLPYAIPAIAMMLIIVLSPPILLLVYPLHYKVLSLLKIGESRCARIVFNPLEKLKPLLDSFQGSFKDKFRFFSGLYFLYRLLILLNVTLSNVQDIYFILLGQLLVILLLHSVCQPYKERRDNIIDSLLFLNLATINGLTMYNFAKVTYDTSMVTVISWIQTILILLPLVVMLLCVLKRVFHCNALVKRIKNKQEETLDDELPARLVYAMDDLSCYKSMEKKH